MTSDAAMTQRRGERDSTKGEMGGWMNGWIVAVIVGGQMRVEMRSGGGGGADPVTSHWLL